MAKDKLKYELTFDKTGIPPTVARLWVDHSGDGALQVGEEVLLGTANGLIWYALDECEVPASGLLFLLKFVAPEGAKWRFKVTDNDSKVRYDSGEQTMRGTKEQCIGVIK